MSRKEGGRGLVRIEDCVDATIRGLKEYVKKSKGRLINAANINIRTKKQLQTNKNNNNNV